MVSIVLHCLTGSPIQVDADRIMYSLPSPEDKNATRVYLDTEKYTVDVKETPETISNLINTAKLQVFNPDSDTARKIRRARDSARLQEYFEKQQKTPDPPK